MKTPKITLNKFLFWIAIAGNFVFILWILFNGMNENFQGTLPEKASYAGLMGLLATNSFLLLRSRQIQQTEND